MGSPALTSRGFIEPDFEQVADFVDRGVKVGEAGSGGVCVCVLCVRLAVCWGWDWGGGGGGGGGGSWECVVCVRVCVL